MEKFGIFELLDALAALEGKEVPSAEKSEQEAPPSEQTAPKAEPDWKDAAFSPPTYSADPPAKAHPKGAAPDQALSNFYARHEEIAKKTRDSKK